jgi:hypothetical protein
VVVIEVRVSSAGGFDDVEETLLDGEASFLAGFRTRGVVELKFVAEYLGGIAETFWTRHSRLARGRDPV